MPREISDLVAAAMKAVGATTQQDLVFELRSRYGVRTDQSQVSRWATGQQGPGYETTMVLLDAAGWLADEPDSLPAATRDPMGRLEDVVVRLEQVLAQVEDPALKRGAK